MKTSSIASPTPLQFQCPKCSGKKSYNAAQCVDCRAKEQSTRMKGRSKGRPALAAIGAQINCTSCKIEHPKRANTNKCEPCIKREAKESIAKCLAEKAAKVARNQGWDHKMSGDLLRVSLVQRSA